MNDDIVRFSEQTDKFWPAFAAARKEMGALKKNASNPHFKSKYADLNAVLDTIEDPYEKHGLLHNEYPGSRVIDGKCLAVVVTFIVHVPSGQWMENTVMLPVPKEDAQAMGSAHTYGRRYSLVGMNGLSAEDDDGNKASERPQKAAPAAPPVKIDDTTKAHFITLTEQLPPAEVTAIIERIQTQFGSAPTGVLDDVHAGDEARYAFSALSKAVKKLTEAA